MPAYKLIILISVLTTLFLTSRGQVSFSTNWGSGKRSNGFRAQSSEDLARVFRTPSDDVSLCLSQLEYNILKEVTTLLRREMTQVSGCLVRNKEVDFE